jgi:tetratricopeptide (TPR) repeat protein
MKSRTSNRCGWPATSASLKPNSVPCRRLFFLPSCLGACFVALALCLARCAQAAEATGSPTAPARAEETNSQEVLRAYLQLQEQLHETQLAIVQNRREAGEAAAENAKALAARLQALEQALATQRSRELETVQSSNRIMLFAAGTFAAIGLGGLVLMAFFQWRTVSRLAEISAGLPLAHGIGPGPAIAALGPGHAPVASLGPGDAATNTVLRSAVERLEARIFELEHTARPPLPEATAQAHPNGTESPAPPHSANGGTPRLSVLLGKGQSLLNLDKAAEALACFNEVLAVEPKHTEALLKKGAALEQLRRYDEAVACYDQAIAADDTLALAYLYKGGLFNRMERFSEALECYELALRAQERRAAPAAG